MHSYVLRAVGLALAVVFYAGTAAADLKIAFIDPLSGGAASTGILAQKTHQFYIDAHQRGAAASTARSSSSCHSTTRSIRRNR